MPQAFDETGLVGPVVFVFGCAVKSLLQEIGLKNLRRLSENQVLAGQRGLDKLFFGLLYGIDNWNSQNRCSAAFGLADDALNIGNCNEWPDTIMYGNNI